jgi:hypothetical protein
MREICFVRFGNTKLRYVATDDFYELKTVCYI